MRRNNLKPIILCLLLCALSPLTAQQKHYSLMNLRGSDQEPWSFGLLFSASSFGVSYAINNPPIEAGSINIIDKTSPGFRFIAEKNLKTNLDLRFEPGIVLERSSVGRLEGGITEIQLPILLKYRARRNSNFNPFLIGGYLLSAKAHQDLADWQIVYDRILHSVELGAGVDVYMKKSKIGIGVRFINGMFTDQKDPDIQIQNIATRAVMLGISFETKDGWKLYAR